MFRPREKVAFQRKFHGDSVTVFLSQCKNFRLVRLVKLLYRHSVLDIEIVRHWRMVGAADLFQLHRHRMNNVLFKRAVGVFTE